MKKLDVGHNLPENTSALLFCGKHGGYSGWTTTVAGETIASCCDKCEAEAAALEHQERCFKIKMNLQRDAFNRSMIPPRFVDKTFVDFKTECDKSEQAKKRLFNYVQKFDIAIKQGTSFLFVGETGTGKTHLACAVANGVMRKGYTSTYISVLNFLSKVKRSWNAAEGESEDSIIESFIPFDLLIFDELNKVPLDAKEKGMIFRLIDRRYEEKKPTIGISRIDEKKISSLIDEDAIRRLKSGGGGTINFDWGAYQEETF